MQTASNFQVAVNLAQNRIASDATKPHAPLALSLSQNFASAYSHNISQAPTPTKA